MNHRNESGDRALIIASRLSHLQCVQSLIQAGADVDITNASGDTAARAGHVNSVYSLVKAGADVNHTE